jgi:WD40-like Beta Propeller Repeat
MNKRTGLALIILITILAACTAQATPMPTEPSTATTQSSATAEPTAVPTVTPTPLSPDAQALKDIVFSDCIPVEEGLPEGFEIQWNLLVSGYVLDLEKGTKEEVPYFSEWIPDIGRRYSPFDYFVSPDGKWLIYRDTDHENLYIEETKTLLLNDETDRIELDKGHWFHIERWMDNQTLLVLYPTNKNTVGYPTVFLNPFTGEEHIFLLEDMPNYLDILFGGVVFATHYLNSGELVPDPTMKRLIYPEWSSDSDIYITNTLWNIENEKPLARLMFSSRTVNDPLWALDGSDVVLFSFAQYQEEWKHEWFLVTADGDVRQITYFGEVWQDNYCYIDNASRSWDGRYLVFEYSCGDLEDRIVKYLLLDLSTETLEGFCVSVQNPSLGFTGPAWSPDNKYLAISSGQTFTVGDVVVVDVENQAAYLIGQDMIGIGWIEKPEGEK